MRTTDMTKREQEILEGIIEFKDENGFPPTVRELCNKTGLKSTSTVAAHLKSLRDKGVITWIDAMPRTITVLRGELAV